MSHHLFSSTARAMNQTKLIYPFLIILGLALLALTFHQLSLQDTISSYQTQQVKLLSHSSDQIRQKWGSKRLYYPKEQSFCGSYEESPTRITLHADGKISVHITPRPDLSYRDLKTFYSGTYSLRNGSLVARLESTLGFRSRVLVMPIQHLNEDGTLNSFNLENEMTQRACL
jgi:hypothetical protein